MTPNSRTPQQIRAELAASRHAMAVGLEGLVSQVHPVAIKNKAVDDAKQKVEDTKSSIKDRFKAVTGYFYDRSGVRWNNVGTVALIATGVCVVAGALSGTAALVRRAVSGE